ncbi:hypothetical protein [Microlunatus speluncae]|uniref:hypothetical protein n=1 Tax=Microlunatus speluncae TaxID=2594267 RepID=UPI00126647DE|nr:hypothetical protein [Microlunatus speluncae]
MSPGASIPEPVEGRARSLPPADAAGARATATADSRLLVLLRRAVFGGWRALPALAVGTALVGAAQTLTMILAPGLSPLTLVAILVLIAPTAGLVVRAAARTVAGEEPTIAELFRSAPRAIGRSVAVAAVPVGFLALLLAAREVWQRTGQPLVVIPYGLCGAAVLITLLTVVTTLPLSLRRTDLRLRRLWPAALAATARNPLPPIGALAVGTIGHWLAVTLYAPLWWLVPLPVALLASVASALLTDPAGDEDGD